MHTEVIFIKLPNNPSRKLLKDLKVKNNQEAMFGIIKIL
jgi:hypothetical protein